MLCNPMQGWRHLEVTERRTAIDYAHLLKDLVDIYYPDALLITVVQDNLNTHSPSSLYKAFEPAEARRILNRLEFMSYPKAWQLAEYGRDRIEHFGTSMFRPTHSRVYCVANRGSRLGRAT